MERWLTRVLNWPVSLDSLTGECNREGQQRSLVGSYHSKYEPLMNRTVTADLPTPPEPMTAH
jgi:hypothetical protein